MPRSRHSTTAWPRAPATRTSGCCSSCARQRPASWCGWPNERGKMSSGEQDRGWDAIAIHPDDDVAVALHDLVAGAIVRVRRGGAIEQVTAAAAIPLGHKMALR